MSASRKIAFSVVGLQLMFDDPFVRRVCEILFKRAFEEYKIFCRKMTFDSDHMHMIMDMGLYSKPELAKKLKGFVACKLFKNMP